MPEPTAPAPSPVRRYDPSPLAVEHWGMTDTGTMMQQLTGDSAAAE